MERRTRSQITMGTSVKQFSVTHPTESSGHQAAVAGLDSVLAEAGTLEDQQREGIITERRGGAVRRGVIDRLWDVHLPHLWAAARRAEREQPDLARTFRLKPAKDTIAARRAAAGSMLEAAQTHKEVLVRYGMDESVLNDLVQGLAEFDAANDRCIAGRGLHVGATARLRVVGREIVGAGAGNRRAQPGAVQERRGAAGGVGQHEHAAGGAEGERGGGTGAESGLGQCAAGGRGGEAGRVSNCGWRRNSGG